MRAIHPSAGWLAGLAITFLLTLAACSGRGASSTPIASSSPRRSTTPAPSGTSLEIRILPGLRFNQADVVVPSNAYVTVTVNNTDDGGAHDLAVYKSEQDADSGAPALARTGICTGPCKKLLNLNLAPGTYFFRCDLHPAQLHGTIVAP